MINLSPVSMHCRNGGFFFLIDFHAPSIHRVTSCLPTALASRPLSCLLFLLRASRLKAALLLTSTTLRVRAVGRSLGLAERGVGGGEIRGEKNVSSVTCKEVLMKSSYRIFMC